MPATVTVSNRLAIPLADLDEPVVRALKEACTHANPEFAKRLAMRKSTYNVPRHIELWRIEKNRTLSLPSGAMKHVRSVFAEHNIELRAVDERSEGYVVSLRKPLTYVGHQLWDHQNKMVEAALAKERCVIRCATGGGKTTAAFVLATKIGLATLVILPNGKLLKQWRKRAIRDLGLKPDQIGIIQRGKRSLRPLTLATQQTLWSRSVDSEMAEFFGAIIVDEAHHVAAATFQKTIDSFKARYRIAFTANERRKDKKEFLVYALMGDVACEVTIEEAEACGAIVDVEMRVFFTEFDFPDYARDRDFDALLKAMVVDDGRNQLALKYIFDEVKAGNQALVLSHRREHVRMLEREFVSRSIPSGVMLGDQERGDEEEFERTGAGLEDGSVLVACGTYQAIGEGIDIPAIYAGVAVTPIWTNEQMANQVRGRFCRSAPGKTHGVLYVPFDRLVFDTKVLKNIIKWNRTVKIRDEAHGMWVDAKQWMKARDARLNGYVRTMHA